MTDKCRRVVLFALDGAQPRAHYNRLLADTTHSAIYSMDGADGFDRFLEAKPDICLINDNISRISVTILCQLIREHKKGQDVGLFILSDFNESDERFAKLRALSIDGVRPVLMNNDTLAAILNRDFRDEHLNKVPLSPAPIALSPDSHAQQFTEPNLVVIDDEDAFNSGINSDSIVLQLKPQETTAQEFAIPLVELTPKMKKVNPAAAPEEMAEITSPNPLPGVSVHDTSQNRPAQDSAATQKIPQAIVGLTAKNDGGLPDISEQITAQQMPVVTDPDEIEVQQEQATPVLEQPELQWDHNKADRAADGEVFNASVAPQNTADQDNNDVTDRHPVPVKDDAALTQNANQALAETNHEDDLANAEAAGLLPLSDDERDSMTIRQAITGSQLGGRLTRRVLALFRLLDSVDYYQLLGVDINANHDELQQAFHSLALEYHPDRFFALADGFIKDRIRALFMRICEAYTVLSQQKTREQYNAMLAARRSGPPPRYSLGEELKAAEKQRCEAYTPVGRKYLRLAVAAMARGDNNAAQLNLTFALSHEPNNETLRQRLNVLEQGA